MARSHRKHRGLFTRLKQFGRNLKLDRLEDRLAPAIGMMGPYSALNLATLQETAGNAWSVLNSAPDPTRNQVSYLDASNAMYFKLNKSVLNDKLGEAPFEFAPDYQSSGNVVSIPRPDGTFQRFNVWEVSIMEPGLVAQFPDIHTYRGQGVDDPTAQLAMDTTYLGFHAQVLSPNGRYYVDPYFHLEQSAYISYYSSDLVNQSPFECDIDQDGNDGFALLKSSTTTTVSNGGSSGTTANKLDTTNGTALRQYRLALAADWEYCNFFGGTNTAVQSALVTAVNRVDGVYESEVAVRLNLVNNNASTNSIIFTTENGYTSSSDPYTDSNGSSMLSQNQTTIDNKIGDANYDIGHVFSTGGGGIAGLGVVTVSGSKSRGVTGQSSPTGDSFWIDYVAHEMGHQFGGNHTFNSSQLGSNRSSAHAYEPGSGSTIMAYAGLGDDYQPHSDPYFHSESLDEITTFIASHPGSATISTGNNFPSVSAGLDYTIPASTLFALTASGSDPDGDPLTYDWQERDLGAADLLNGPDNGASPRFRPFNPTTSPTRTLPRISDILANTDLSTAKTGERLFTTARTSTWRVVARDNKAGGGAFSSDDMTLTVVNTGAAFAVTSPNTAVTWVKNTTQTVTWNVAGTTASGINTANVDILLSTDGGLTFPTMLLANTPNDGSQSVLLPNTMSTTARIKVQAVGNVFFDVSNTNFTIGSPFSVASVAPSSGSLVTAPFTQVDVTFDANVDSTTLDVGDLSLSQGLVTNVQLLTPQTARYTLSGMTAEGNVAVTVNTAAVSDTLGNGNNAFTANYTIDYATTTFTTPLTVSGTRGVLAYTGTMTGVINTVADTDAFTINLDAGQNLSVVLTAAPTLRGNFNLSGPGGVNQTISASTAGATVVLQTLPIVTAGTYTLTVSSFSASTTGAYTARLDLNAAEEAESNGGASNNTTGAGQALTGFVSLGGGSDRAVVRGQMEVPDGLATEVESNNTIATATSAANDFLFGANGAYQMLITGGFTGTDSNDYFKIGPMQNLTPSIDALTVAISGMDGGRGTLANPVAYIYRAGTSSVVTNNNDRASGFQDSLIYQLPIPITDTNYYVNSNVTSGTGTYQMSLYLQNASTAPTTGSGLHTEGSASNGSKDIAEDASADWVAVNYTSNVNGSISSTSDVDYYKFTFSVGDIVSAFANTGGSADLSLAFYNSAGTLLYNEKGASTALGLTSAMYAYRITTAGDYYVRVSSINSTTGSYTLHTELSATAAPPAPPTPYDHYSFGVTAGQPLALAIKGLSTGSLSFDLLNASGSVMGSGTAGSTNFDKTLNITPSATETWFVRLNGDAYTDYQMVVTRGAALDSEANDTFATAQTLLNNRALGAISTANNDDWYQFPVTAGQVITLSTTTPGDGTGEFVNNLDPAIELWDPSNMSVGFDDNAAGDGRNAVLTKTTTTTGNYRARVIGAANTTGEYVLSLSVSSDPTPSVSSTVIDDGSNRRSRVTSFTVNFSEPVTLPTNKSDAFVLTRTYPTSDTVTVAVDDTIFTSSGGTQAVLTFSGPVTEFTSLADGNYTLTILAGQVLDATSQPMAANFSVNFHRLFGDYDNDKVVTLTDFANFRGFFNLGANHAFDFDNDGNVTLTDFAKFRSNFNLTLP